MRLFWEGVPPGSRTRLAYYTGERTRLVEQPGLTRLCIDLRRRVADARVREGAEWSASFGCLIPVLSEFLPEVASCLVHAASAADAPGGRAVLISGPSGAGKTTAALALTRGGLRLLTDDATVLTRCRGEIAAWGVPRPCKVRRRTLELLPWLRELPDASRAEEEEFALDPAQFSLPHPQRPARVALVLMLQERNGERHRLAPMERVDALTRLANENVRALEPRAEAGPGTMFAMLAQLVRQCPVFALSVGPSLQKLPELVLSALDGRNADAPGT
jgi:hypothetical protein